MTITQARIPLFLTVLCMESTIFSQDASQLNYGFLLLTHVVCSDQQIHNQEARALRELAEQASINEATLHEMEKILGQDASHLALTDVAQQVPLGQRSEAIRQVMAVAYVDGFFSPLEREEINRIAQLWGIYEHEIEQMLEEAQGFGRWQTDTADQDELSIGARLLKGAESVLSRSLITKLAELAPQHISQRIECLQREILLSGPEYDDAIQQCARIANEDFKYANRALRWAFNALKDLGNGIQPVIYEINQKTTGEGEYQAAKEVAKQLEQTRRELSAEILHDLETVREALRSKQRALDHFSIAFIGRTKAGKSTLHAVITGEGWEAIGVGKQRTTRYNRVYEWKNIRIIDTPGIGAPGGKTDEEIARSVIEEADVICYVVTDDSIQEAEFAFLKVLKEKTKPLVVLLNIQYNLRDSRRLEHFLKNPGRWFAAEGKSGIGGHLNRIQRYAKEHYPNDYLTVIPVMLLAAQLAQELEHEKQSKNLFQTSRIQDFLDIIRLSLVDYGAIRRSQTLLGSTVGSIIKPQQWINEQATIYSTLASQLRDKKESLKQDLQTAESDVWEYLQNELATIFRAAFDCVTPFAEKHWNLSESEMNSGWKKELKSLKFEKKLETAFEDASQKFQEDVRETLEEIGNELRLIYQLHHSGFQFVEQDSNFVDRKFVRIGGMLLAATGAITGVFALSFPPLAIVAGIATGAATIVGLVTGSFKSREQKRHKAVQQISASLKEQLEKRQDKVLRKAKEDFEKYCQSIGIAVDEYFEELIKGIAALASQLETAQQALLKAANYLNRSYAKRVVDWATDQHEPLTDISISRKIRQVERDFGRNFHIQTSTALPLTKSPDEICQILQENVSIQPVKR